MAVTDCIDSINVSFPTGMSGDMDVITKYEELMKATIADDSLYTRTKETFYEVFKDLEMDAEEKAKMVADSMSKIAMQLSSTAMQSSVLWAKEERDGYYSTALTYAQTMKTQIDAEVAKVEVCKAEADLELICAKSIATIAGSIRENGMHIVEDGSCTPTGVDNTGLKYEQTNMVVQQTASMVKEDTRKDAKNDEDILFSERQRQSFEDSKRNHAANAASQMISGLIASEIGRDGNEDLIGYWSIAMNYLTSEQAL